MPAINDYSPTWYELFLEPVPLEQTEREIAFLARQLPRPAYPAVLDVCCGLGRHVRALARLGYRVTGVDANAAALAAARRASGSAVDYVELDMRRLATLPGRFDAAIIMWQSFGYFDDAANLDVMRQARAVLAPQGRLVLDIYHRGFFERHEGTRTMQIGVVSVTENRFMRGSRLSVTLDYGPGRAADAFEWRLYTPEELLSLAAPLGYSPVVVCSNFDEGEPPTPERARWQAVLGLAG